MIENKLEIFKFQIYCIKLNFDIKNIANFCLKLNKNNKGVTKSNRGGWQSQEIYNEYPLINKLKNVIFENANVYIKEFKLNKNLEFKDLWININGYKDHNALHHHYPGSVISGVYYVKTFKNSGVLRFMNPLSEWMQETFKNKIFEFNPNNSPAWDICPEDNLLVLFPSYLKHEVLPNLNKNKRISISFNIGIV